MSEAERERQRMQQEAKRLFESTRTEAEKYAAELEKIEELHSGGFINADTYGRALEQLKEKYDGASDAAKFFQQQASRAADSLVDLAIDGGSLIDIMDQVGRTIAKAALQAALFGQGPMAGLFGQTPGVGLFSNIFKFATGTNNAPGGMALVGEQGPELVNLPRGASVTPADRMKGELRQVRPQVAAPQVNTKIVNVLDPGLVGEYLSTAQGEQLIMNVVNRNQGDR